MGMNRRAGSGRKRGLNSVKDDEDDEEEDADDGEGDLEKPVPENVNPERQKAFNVCDLEVATNVLSSCNRLVIVKLVSWFVTAC